MKDHIYNCAGHIISDDDDRKVHDYNIHSKRVTFLYRIIRDNFQVIV